MAIRPSLAGRLRNTSLPRSHALLPLFEAVVNAIQAVEENHRDGLESAHVTVEIVRLPQGTLDVGLDQDAAPAEPIVEFVVRDNGEGFHDDNMNSFETLDSQYKSDVGGRGVGRLLWLKAFQRVEVESHYRDSAGTLKRRAFRFSENDGISRFVTEDDEDTEVGTSIRLVGFREFYRKAAAKTASTIARSILEHCLWYFVREGGAPRMAVVDGPETIDLRDVLADYTLSPVERETILVKARTFDLIHLRLKTTAKNAPYLSWCAARRVVVEENLSGKVPGLHGKLRDAQSEFMYACFLTSQYLSDNVRAERTDFDIPETVEDLLDDSVPSKSDIRTATLAAIEQHLIGSLEGARREGRQRVENFVATKAPRYRPILKRIDETKLSVDPKISDRDLELHLHRALAEIEREVLVEGPQVLALAAPGDSEYDRRLQEYLDKVDDIKRSDLASYVSKRRVILDLLARAIEVNEEGKYVNEDVIHKLVVPMRVTSDDVSPSASNLWLIDEGLAFHDFLASDKTIKSMPITDSVSPREPDILALRVFDTPILVSEGATLPLASIVVVEFKRPMRDDANSDDKDPISQTLGYLNRVREGRVTTASGRLISNADRVPGFCYVVADMTSTMKRRCMDKGYRRTQDGLGYFGFNEPYNAYVEVLSYERLLHEASRRNRAFFDQLGLPIL